MLNFLIGGGDNGYIIQITTDNAEEYEALYNAIRNVMTKEKKSTEKFLKDFKPFDNNKQIDKDLKSIEEFGRFLKDLNERLKNEEEEE